MFTLPRQRGNTDRGMTLIEVLVAIFLLAIVGTIISGIVISAMKLTRTTTSGVDGQSQLNDAISRISRDIAAADPILYTNNADDSRWKTTPAVDELWTQGVSNGTCVRTRYYVATNGSKKTLNSDTRTYADASCPDPRLYDTGGTLNTKVIIKDLKTTNDQGTDLPIFSYFDSANAPIAAPVVRANVESIARVKIDVGSNVQDRANGVRLTTSIAPRSNQNSLVTNVAPPRCAGVGGANPRVVMDTNDPSTPIISWDRTDNADSFTLTRSTPLVQNWLPVTTSPFSVTDTAMRGWWGGPGTPVTFSYMLTVEGPGGIAPCGPFSVGSTPAAPLAAPAISVTVTPDTSGGPGTITSPQVNISWGAVARATGYHVYRRPIDANTSPYLPTGTGTWTPITAVGGTTSTSWADNPGFNQAFEYKVVAVSTLYTPNLTSADSSSAKALTHTSNVALTGVPLTYNQNRLTWTAETGTTVDGYAVFSRAAGTTPWGAPIADVGPGTLTFTNLGVALDSRMEYLVTSYNVGPRGTAFGGAATRYYGNASNTVSVLQYPGTPQTIATGTETAPARGSVNPDGTNAAYWDATNSPSATYYLLEESDTLGGTATVSTNVGNTTSRTDPTGNALGTRNFYMAVACNPTGCSQNSLAGSPSRATVADSAYQRPATVAFTVGNATADSCPDVAEAANNRVFHCNNATATATWTNNADAGEAADKFCSAPGNPGQCSYIAGSTAGNKAAVYGAPASPTASFTQTAWGATDAAAVVACNEGGCSAPAPVDVRAYPGPFNANPGGQTEETNHDMWWENGNQTSGSRAESKVNVDWTQSAGSRQTAYQYRVARTVRADDRLDKTFSDWTGVQTSGLRDSTPGAAYNYTVEAYAENGLGRGIAFSVQTKPGKVGFLQSTRFCNSAVRKVDETKDTKQVCSMVQVTKWRQSAPKTRWVACAQNNPGADCVNTAYKYWEKYADDPQTWSYCSQTNPGAECQNFGQTPLYQARTGAFQNCGDVHATSNPDPGTCTSPSAYHWMQGTSPNFTDCNPYNGSTKPGTCVNKTGINHWIRRAWVNCADQRTNSGGTCTNNGGTPNWMKRDPITKSWQACAQNNPGPECVNRQPAYWERQETYTELESYTEWEEQCETVPDPQPINEPINEWGWKSGYKFRKGAYDNGGLYTKVDRWDMTEFAGRLTLGQMDNGNNWYNRAEAVYGVGGGAWLTKKPQLWEPGDAMWSNNSSSSDQSISATVSMATTWGATEELISNTVGSGGAVSIRGIVNATGAHNTDYGTFVGPTSGVNEYSGSNTPMACGEGWNANPSFITRWVHVSSPAHYRPGSSLADWNANG